MSSGSYSTWNQMEDSTKPLKPDNIANGSKWNMSNY